MMLTFRAMAIDWKKTKIHRKNTVKVEKVSCLPDGQEMKRLDKVSSQESLSQFDDIESESN